MRPNLDELKDDIQKELGAQGFVVFRGYAHHGDSRPTAYWDAAGDGDFRPFLATARQAGVKLVVFHKLEFVSGMAEDALDQLQDCELPPEERRAYERKLREMLSYHGFTCRLELSYDCEGRTYVFDLQADWYRDFLNILDELDALGPEDEGNQEEDSMGGYFSRN